MDRFPLDASVPYTYEDRFNDSHRGTDILAPAGSPILAVEKGAAWSDIDPKGGKVVYLIGESGAHYYYAHLQEWALKLISATRQQPWPVEAGDVVGKVGTTGNAAGRPPHIHFQMKFVGAFGQTQVNPFPDLIMADPKASHERPRSVGPLDRLEKAATDAMNTGISGLGLILLVWLISRQRR
jgi:murein DD-endopeptidase MepM/ murein hydrolase activator NlpD